MDGRKQEALEAKLEMMMKKFEALERDVMLGNVVCQRNRAVSEN